MTDTLDITTEIEEIRRLKSIARKMILDNGVGVEYYIGNHQYMIVLPDPEEQGKFRIQEFDINGFIGHTGPFDTMELLADHVATWHYRPLKRVTVLNNMSMQDCWRQW